MTQKRRRGIQSDWILSLKRSRRTKRLRRKLSAREFPTPNNVALANTSDAPYFMPGSPDVEFPSRQTTPVPDEAGQGSISISATKHSGLPAQGGHSAEDIPELDHNRQRESDECTPLLDNEIEPFDPFGEEYTDVMGEPANYSTENRLPDEELPQLTHSHHTQRAGNHEQDQAGTIDLNSHSAQNSNIQALNIERLLSARRKWENRSTLSALVAVIGSVRYSVEQYNYTRDLLKENCPGAGVQSSDQWPSYYRVHKYFGEIVKRCLPHSEIVKLPKRTGNRQLQTQENDLGISSTPSETTSSQFTENVRIFLPRAWARLDVATSTVYEMMSEQNSECHEHGMDLEQSMIVQQRELAINSCDHLMVPRNELETVPCVPGTSIKIWLKRRRYDFDIPFVFEIEEELQSITATVSATWCVGARRSKNLSYGRAKNYEHITEEQRAIMRTLSNADCRSNRSYDVEYNVIPGDICTLLSAGRESLSTEYDALLINRFWRLEDGKPSMLILWLRAQERQDEERGDTFCEVEVADYDVVSRVRLGSERSTGVEGIDSEPRKDTRLADGTPYIVYRILLYCDDFQKSSSASRKGSAAGCYFLPLSLPPETRRSTSAVRIISLTPPGVSTNDVLKYIVDDLVHATVHGVDGITPSGERIRIFLDVVGFVGDYPAAASTLDVHGHVARAPCTLCTFRRLHASETDGSRFGFTTEVHSGNTTFLRHGERHESLRGSGISDGDANVLGMVSSATAHQRACPLMKLSQRLNNERSLIPLNSSGRPVTTGLFDPFRCNFVAPDHLRTGLSQDVLNTVFKCLPSDVFRRVADLYICEALRRNGILPQSRIFNWQKKTLHSTTLSELYCILVVSGPSLSILTSRCEQESVCRQAIFLLISLSKLIALTYWYPKQEIDGDEAVRFVHIDTRKYHSELKRLSKDYVANVDTFCRQFPERKEHLDKPNLHRLIELYEHSIPLFGHVRQFMELVFEGAHQPLKICITNSNNRDAHIFAAEHCVANDWQGRLSILSRILDDETSPKKPDARRGLRRLLLGVDSEALSDSEHKDFIEETDMILGNLFTTAVKRRFQSDNRISNFATTKISSWEARTKVSATNLSRIIGLSRTETTQIIDTAIRWIDATYPPLHAQEEGNDITSLYMSAKRTKLTKDGRRTGSLRGFDVISPNSVIRGLIHVQETKNKVMQTTSGTRGVASFFAVAAILHRTDDFVWAVCSKCRVTTTAYHERIIQTERALDMHSFQVLLITPDVRRVAVYHICQDRNQPNMCTLDFEHRTIRHVKEPLDGANMWVQTRKEGYPPRRS